MMGKSNTVGAALGVALIAGCSNGETYDAAAEKAKFDAEARSSGFDSSSLPATNEGKAFNVESDSKASYRLLTWERMPNGNIEALTRRDGPSGTSFARREIDCSLRLFKYLGEGDTREQAMKDSQSSGEMSALVAGSIADVTVARVCAAAKK